MKCARRHPERSEAKSKDPVEVAQGFVAGFLDFARNDGELVIAINHVHFGR